MGRKRNSVFELNQEKQKVTALSVSGQIIQQTSCEKDQKEVDW